MAYVLSEDQFRCSICLDIFTKPVSIPCGHNFCLDCIKGYWDTKVTSECPLCKETFLRSPELRINRDFADITERFKGSLKSQCNFYDGGDGVSPPSMVVEQRSPGQHVGPSEVLCDVCGVSGSRRRAVKSCAVCMVSYCETHVGPHRTEPALRGHALDDPETAFTAIKALLKRTEERFEQEIHTRLKKAEEIRHLLTVSKQSAEGAIEAFVELMKRVEQVQAAVVKEIQDQQGMAERRAEEILKELEEEIVELMRRRSELEQLQHTRDNLHLLQSFSSLSAPPPTKDWSKVSVCSHVSMATVRREVSKLVNLCQDLETKFTIEELKMNSQYAVDVTLDGDTAAAWLVLSPDGKQVSHGYQQSRVPNNPERFDSCVCVLGKQAFTSGRHFWVVQVGEKTDWDLGVAKQSVNRKGSIRVCLDTGYWAICRRRAGGLSACAGPPVALALRGAWPREVAVFLDYEEGVVSFYDAGGRVHLHTFTGCAFNGAVLPYFNPCLHDDGKNAAPLVIRPVGWDLLDKAPPTATVATPVPTPRRLIRSGNRMVRSSTSHF